MAGAVSRHAYFGWVTASTAALRELERRMLGDPQAEVEYLGQMASARGGMRFGVRLGEDYRAMFNHLAVDDDTVDVALAVAGTGHRRLGRTLLDVFGLDGDDEHGDPLACEYLTQRSWTEPLHADLEANTALVEIWADVVNSGPVLLIHAPNAATAKQVARFHRAVVPGFVVSTTPTIVVDNDGRSLLNSLLPKPLPYKGAMVAYRHEKQWVVRPIGGLDGRAARAAVIALQSAMSVGYTRLLEMSSHVDGKQVTDPDPDREALLAEVEAAQQEAAAAVTRAELAQRDLTRARREIDRLRRDLVADEAAVVGTDDDAPGDRAEGGRPTGRGVVEEAAPVTDEPPCQTFPDLYAQARATLTHVVLSESLEAQSEPLRHHAKQDTWVARTRAILTVLNDYALAREAKEPIRNFRHYLEGLAHPPFPAAQVRLTESVAVRRGRKFRDSRTFPVPVEVDPSGWADFGAHIRVDSGGKGAIAPRLHFHDDTNGQTGKVFIGYVGPHLPNTMTN